MGPRREDHENDRPRPRFVSTQDESRDLLSTRLATFIGVMVGIRVVTIVVLALVEWLSRPETTFLGRASGKAGIVVTLLMGGVVLLLHKVRLSLRVLRGIDVTLTLALAMAAAFSIPIETMKASAVGNPLLAVSRDAHELKALLIVAHLLVLRAALVPSHPALTAVLGACAAAALSTGAWIAHGRAPAPAPGAVPFLNALVWASFSVIVSTACSAVIYGLRQNVRDAKHLGQYTLEHKLGEGGMGVVYRARHALLRRPTAIKVLSPERVGQAALARFEREVQLTAKLSHPNIVSVYDFGRSRDGVFYYAMEFLDGIDLQKLVDTHGAQPPGRVRWLLRQAAAALAEAHAVQLTHRDVKPANMILTRRASETDVLKLVDFGLVKEIETNAEGTATGVQDVQGTPLYMSPESVVDPRTVGPRSDLYALGAVGYFLLTGIPVFDGETTVAILAKHAHQRPDPPSARSRGVPPKLEAVILRCLEKDPARRFDDARALERALDACDDVLPWTAQDALEWWQRTSLSAAVVTRSSPSPFDRTLAVDLRDRAAAVR